MAKRERWDQASHRRTVVFTDQHGREWSGMKDVRTDTPIGELSPMGWRPPMFRGRLLLPSPNYMRYDEMRPGQFAIDYDQWYQDLLESHREWVHQRGMFASQMYGDKAAEAEEKMPPALRNLMGIQPMPVELVDAMRGENKWILGLSDKRPSWAAEFFAADAPRAADRFFDVAEDATEDGEGEAVTAGRTRDGSGRFTKDEEE